MPYSMPDGPTIVIASGQTDSPAMLLDSTISDAEQVSILAPATLPETITIEISLDFNRNYQADGQTLAAATAAASWDVVPPTAPTFTAGAVTLVQMSQMSAIAWRLHASGAVAATRTFRSVKRTPIDNQVC